MKQKMKYVCFILFSLICVVAITVSFAWVINSREVKIASNQIIVTDTEQLVISIGKAYSGHLDLNDETISDYAADIKKLSLKDLSGDGLNLFSPTVDPFKREPYETGWSNKRLSTGDADIIAALNAQNENKCYLSFKVDFKSNIPLDIYLSKNSYVSPSTDGMESTQVLFLKRTAKYKYQTTSETDPFDKTRVEYIYETENGVLTNTGSLPTVFNRSVYCSETFDDSIDEKVFRAKTSDKVDGYYISEQSIYSANYIAGAVRLAFIDENATGNYLDASKGSDGHYDYTSSKLKMIWAPNPLFQGEDKYDEASDSHSYIFDIKTEEENKRTGDEIGNSYYLIDPNTTIGTKRTFEPDMFTSNLFETEETVSNYNHASDEDRANMKKPHKLLTLSEENNTYVGSLRIVMWVEGSDLEAMVSLTTGDYSESGMSTLMFLLSFFGVESVTE